jgi:hypothetical protein
MFYGVSRTLPCYRVMGGACRLIVESSSSGANVQGSRQIAAVPLVPNSTWSIHLQATHPRAFDELAISWLKLHAGQCPCIFFLLSYTCAAS